MSIRFSWILPLTNLMQYPIHVTRDGIVGPLAGFETFPDVGGKILGSPITLPDALMT